MHMEWYYTRLVPEHSIHETGGWESGKKRGQEGYRRWERLEREEGGSFNRMGSGKNRRKLRNNTRSPSPMGS